MKKYIFLCGCLLLLQTTLWSRDHSVLDYGADPSGQKLCTKALQSAIDQAHKEGGGRVVLPKGTFLSGSLILRSGVDLYLEKNAVLLGSPNPADYIQLNRWKALVMADSARNVSISGKGVLDGQGAALALHLDSLFYAGDLDSADYTFPEMRPRVTLRPQILEFFKCEDIRVTGVTLKNAAGWVQSYYMCRDILIDRIKVDSDAYWNNDGIDIIDCQKVRITDCFVNASDDGICIKSYGHPREGRPFCDSLYIADCTVRSSASAVKFGTASFGGFKNVVVERIKVYDTFRSAIAVESYGYGVVENVLIQDIKAKNTGNAIFIRIGKRYPQYPPGIIRKLTIRNVKVEVPFAQADLDYEIRGPSLPFFHNIFPSSITGVPGQAVQDVTLENIEIIFPGRGNPAYAHLPLHRLDDIPEVIDKYPEFSMFGELPAWGFYVRHAEGLTFKNVKLRLKNADYRPAFVFDDVEGLSLEGVQISGDTKEQKMHFREVKKLSRDD